MDLGIRNYFKMKVAQRDNSVV